MCRFSAGLCRFSPAWADRRQGPGTIASMPTARYDGIAEWYDEAIGPATLSWTHVVKRLLGRGPGRCLDLGCGTGLHIPTLLDLGWTVTGVDLSHDQLRRARGRVAGQAELVHADAAELPFPDATFDSLLSMFTHTDVGDFAALLEEAARVMRPRAPLVYVGVHPCFVGPHSRFVRGEGVPTLHPGYRTSGPYDDAPGVNPDGLRAKVGAVHLPLAEFLQAFLDAGFRLEHVEEPGSGLYPVPLALLARR